MGCASSKGAAAVPATGNGNAPNDSAGPIIVVTDTLKPPDPIIEEGELPPKPEDTEPPEAAVVEEEAEKPSDNADAVDDTDEVVREIQLAVPEVTDEDNVSDQPEESAPESSAPEPEATEEDGENAVTNEEEEDANKTEEPMDTNDETLLNEIQEEEAPKVVAVEEASEE